MKGGLRYFFLLTCLLTCLLLPALSLAAEQKAIIRAVSFSSEGADAEKVSFELSSAENLPKIQFYKGDKPRLVLDFLAMDYRGKSQIAVADGLFVERIRAAQHTNPVYKTRVVIDLKHNEGFQYQENFTVNSQVFSVHLSASSRTQESGSGKTEKKISASVQDFSVQPEKKAENKKLDSSREISVPDPQLQTSQPDTLALSEAQEKQSADTSVDGQKKENQPFSSQKTASPAQPEKALITLQDVGVLSSRNNSEMVRMKLSAFQEPEVAALEGDAPEVRCTFPVAQLAESVKEEFAAKGKYVQSVRISKDSATDRVLVQLFLEPSHDYDIQQVFSREESVFALVVSLLDEKTEAQNTLKAHGK